jgi:hypothetical protein
LSSAISRSRSVKASSSASAPKRNGLASVYRLIAYRISIITWIYVIAI